MSFFSNHIFLKLRSKTHHSRLKLDSGVVVSYYVDKKLGLFQRLVIVEFITEGEREWLSEFVELVQEKHPKLDFIAKPQANVVIDNVPREIRGLSTVPWGTYIKNIALPDEELLRSFKENARRNIKKAVTQGIEVEEVDATLCHAVLKNMFCRQGQPAYAPSLSLLEDIQHQLKDNVIMIGAFDKGEVQSVVAIPFDEVRGYYLYGATVPSPSRGAMHLLQYELMRRLRDKGIKEYDFFGARLSVDKKSKIAGIQRFKQSFNPRLVEGHSFKLVLRPWKYRLFELSVAIFYRLKGSRYQGDPIDQVLKVQPDG